MSRTDAVDGGTWRRLGGEIGTPRFCGETRRGRRDERGVVWFGLVIGRHRAGGSSAYHAGGYANGPGVWYLAAWTGAFEAGFDACGGVSVVGEISCGEAQVRAARCWPMGQGLRVGIDMQCVRHELICRPFLWGALTVVYAAGLRLARQKV